MYFSSPLFCVFFSSFFVCSAGCVLVLPSHPKSGISYLSLGIKISFFLFCFCKTLKCISKPSMYCRAQENRNLDLAPSWALLGLQLCIILRVFHLYNKILTVNSQFSELGGEKIPPTCFLAKKIWVRTSKMDFFLELWIFFLNYLDCFDRAPTPGA